MEIASSPLDDMWLQSDHGGWALEFL